MTRFLRLIVVACLAAGVVPAGAAAAQRMYVGFQDDPSFRWRPDRQQLLDRAREANATVIRATVYWSQVAPTRPASPSNPFDPSYRRLNDLDELVRNAEARGLEVMLTIWGTPDWADGGKGQNHLPSNLADLTAFSHALAARYSGRYPGYPFVRFYSVWNEPNLEQFLAPQFDATGRSVGPELYARLYRAAYAGIKSGSPSALVAIGETSARGRDKPTAGGTQQTHSPGRFAELLSQVRPRLQFDAWAHHPYPTDPGLKPTQKVRWPNVTLPSLGRFEASLDTWFGRKGIPIWITEYGHETKPQEPKGVPYSTQAAYAKQALSIAAADPNVQMLIWFTFRDDSTNTWQSGLLAANGTRKPAFARFAAAAGGLDARNAIVPVKGANPMIRISALEIAWHSPAGSRIGVIWKLLGGKTTLSSTPEVRMGRDGWISFRLPFLPLAGRSYTLQVTAEDINGIRVNRTLRLIATAA